MTSATAPIEAHRAAFADALQSLMPAEHVEPALRAVDQLIAWSDRHAKLLRHHPDGDELESITYRLTRSGYVAWVVRPGAGDGARLELLPRVAATLSPAVQTELRSRLAAIQETALDGLVPTVPLLALGAPDAMKALLATLDWVLPHTNDRV